MSTEINSPEPDLSEFADLAVALEAARPEPTEEFTERLDTAVADHFPREWSEEPWGDSRDGFFAPIKRWLRSLNRHRLPVLAGGAGLAVAIVAVGIGMNRGPDQPSGSATPVVGSATSEDAGARFLDKSYPSSESSAGVAPGSVKLEPESLAQADAGGHIARVRPASKSPGPYAATIANRKVAQEAEITLGTKPENVQEVSNEIVETVDDHNGIVLDSSVKDGPAGEAGADFSLMIPSAQLESAISDLSGIADLRARNQETEDITAPTLTVQDSLQTARARVESLVGQLADATTDDERAKVEDELGQERRKVARLTTKLNRLDRKANLTPVAVTVETGGDTSAGENDSSWGITDAVDDAGRMLAIAAGVALIALAVAIPVALLVLIALALNRAWVRRARRRALDES